MKTHWKQLVNKVYLGCYSLPNGEDLTLTINKVVKEEITGVREKHQERAVLYLKNQKPMILNVTNFKTLTKLFGSPYVEDWAGKSFTVFASTTKYAGETVEALRIREKAPIKPKLTPTSVKWDDAKKALKLGNATMVQIKNTYDITKKDEEALNG